MKILFPSINISAERKKTIIEEISLGSEPRGSFYALLLTASLIACFGLIANSTAVVIGAMLVSPLMTPIQGMALALVRGDTHLMGHAVRSEVVGVVLAVFVPALVGLLPLNVEATSEMLARTQPNLMDLLVAVLAGFAGALAMIDERISPALPGVAIATAIVPPLANCGLCLGLGVYSDAFGSFLLFFANFLSILLVTAVLYLMAGLAPHRKYVSVWDFVRIFGHVILGFFVLGAFLTHALFGIIHTRKVNHTIKEALETVLAQSSNASLDNLVTVIKKDSVEALAMIRSAHLISPDRVKKFQDALSEKIGQDVHLVFRNSLTKDIGATGDVNQISSQALDRTFQEKKATERQLLQKTAEQTLWELLASRPDFQLMGVACGHVQRGKVIIATLQGFRQPTMDEIRNTEKILQNRLQDPLLNLIIRFTPGILLDRNGEVLFGWTNYGSDMHANQPAFDKARSAVRELFSSDYNGAILSGIHFNASLDPLGILIDVDGQDASRAMDDRKIIENRLNTSLGHPVRVYIRSRSNVVLTPDGQETMDNLLKKGWDGAQARMIREWPNID